MSLWTRVRNVFRRSALDQELSEEMEAHIADAVAAGRDPAEARRAFGSMLRTAEASRDLKMAVWLDSLRADAVFGWRQLRKHPASTAAAVLSLGLAMGACLAAFRLIDAALLRPLPVKQPERSYFVQFESVDGTGNTRLDDFFDYPAFRMLREAVREDADLLAVGISIPTEVSFGGQEEKERAQRLYLSGSAFGSWGLRPALGRLFTEEDDRTPGAHPVAVLSHHYWASRFGSDPTVVGRKFRIGETMYEIIGVLPRGFYGPEPGSGVDFYVPTMMNTRAVENPNWGWFRIWVRPHPGAGLERVRQQLQARFWAYREERAKGFAAEMPKDRIEAFTRATLYLPSAATGVSQFQKEFRTPLLTLGGLVALVLLLACGNLANWMLGRSASRAREMGLRVSIGAGRWRLLQMMLVESGIVALAASTAGVLFSQYAAPLVFGRSQGAESRAMLDLAMDWRVTVFAAGMTLLVTLLFGLLPALRASGVRPQEAMQGGAQLHGRRRAMRGLIAMQSASCVVVLLVGGLFVLSSDRLANRYLGFTTDRLFTVTVQNAAKENREAVWQQALQDLRSRAGVSAAARSSWALMGGNTWMSGIRFPGRPMPKTAPYFLAVSPGFMETMQITLREGRDLADSDRDPGSVLVNEAFVRTYLEGQNAVGRTFERLIENKPHTVQIVGVVRDARYGEMREEIRPTVYVPVRSLQGDSDSWTTFVVRTEISDVAAVAPLLRATILENRPMLRVEEIRTQQELVDSHLVRERLLAMLSWFFAGTALGLAAMGLYGVLHYAVVQRRREIGVRRALGATDGHVVRTVLGEVMPMISLGAALGIAMGMGVSRYIQSLLFGVRATDSDVVATPVAALFAVALMASLPPLIQALRTDPASTLRSE